MDPRAAHRGEAVTLRSSFDPKRTLWRASKLVRGRYSILVRRPSGTKSPSKNCCYSMQHCSVNYQVGGIEPSVGLDNSLG